MLLNEIGDLGASAQAKLLTFLEQRTFFCLTHRLLGVAFAAG